MIEQADLNFNKQNAAIRPAFSDFPVSRKSYFSLPPESEKQVKQEKNHKLGITIAASAVILGLGVLAMMRGLPKGVTQKTIELAKILENKVTKLANESKTSKAAKFYKNALTKVQNLSQYFNSVNNATTLKDIWFGKICGKCGFLNKGAKKITALFEKFSRRTVQNGYNQAQYRFNRMSETFGTYDELIARNPNKQITINGVTKAAQEWLKDISGKRTVMLNNFNLNFGKNALQHRYTSVKEAMTDLDEAVLYFINGGSKDAKVWKLNFKDVKNKEIWNRRIEYLKQKLSQKELYDTFIPQTLLEHDKINLKNTVNGYKNIITGCPDKKGQLEEIMEIYKYLLEPKEFGKLKTCSDKAVKQLDKAVSLETDKFFDKLRDITLGSAPTDVLSMVTGLGAVGIGLTKTDNKQDRVSILLKYGIPALGTIATSLCLGAALVSGGSAFLLSLLSGLIINKIGTAADNYIAGHRSLKSDKNIL